MHMSDVSSSAAVNEVSSNFRENKRSEAKGMGWLLPLLLLVFAAALILYFVKGSHTATMPVAQQFIAAIDTSANKSANQKVDSANPYSTEIALPDNSFITGAKNGIEYHLVEYMNAKDTINKNRWFNFDKLSFENDDAMLRSSSIHQIENIVSILKAYSKMKIKIGAFTDKTNDETADLKLTEQQANSVAGALKKAGANSTQIVSAEGYGSKYARADVNSSLNEKMKDRKISINVTEK